MAKWFLSRIGPAPELIIEIPDAGLVGKSPGGSGGLYPTGEDAERGQVLECDLGVAGFGRVRRPVSDTERDSDAEMLCPFMERVPAGGSRLSIEEAKPWPVAWLESERLGVQLLAVLAASELTACPILYGWWRRRGRQGGSGRAEPYLAAVIDLWSRRVVGWSMRDDLSTPLVTDALDMAIGQRKPDRVIHHSDRGSQY